MSQTRTYTHASLFSGIGGFDLAARWMGWNNAFHCEINPFCLKVLRHHFKESESYEDITKTDFRKWEGKVDVLSGGFPCQPFSLAGQRRGAEDNRYLWPQMLRAIREIKPAWVVGENVAGILTMVQPGTQVEVERSTSLFGEGYTEQEHRQQYVIETICRDLEQEGYSVQPMLIPACAVGAPHRRDRIWFVAHRADAGIEGMQREWKDGVHAADDATDTDINRCRDRKNEQIEIEECEGAANNCIISKAWITPDTERIRGNKVDHQVQPEQPNGNRADGNGCKRIAADTDGKRCNNGECHRERRYVCDESERELPKNKPERSERKRGDCKIYQAASNTESQQSERCEPEQPCNGSKEQKELGGSNRQSHTAGTGIPDWRNFPTQSPVCSRNDGLSSRLDGISFPAWRRESVKAYGNAIVPQVAYEIFKLIEKSFKTEFY